MKQRTTGRLTRKRIAIYARYSSENQRESSIEDQLYRARDFVDREGGDKAGVLVVSDRAASGSRFGREGITKLRDLAQTGQIDAVVVEDMSRLTRDQEHAAALLKLFARCGVTLYGIADGIDTSQSKARLNVGLRALMAEDYLADLADKTLRGQEGRARAGLSTGGRLYGYRSEPVPDGCGGVAGYKFVIHSEEAKIVTRIFESYVAGLSHAAIANELNRDKIPVAPRQPEARLEPEVLPTRVVGQHRARHAPQHGLHREASVQA